MMILKASGVRAAAAGLLVLCACAAVARGEPAAPAAVPSTTPAVSPTPPVAVAPSASPGTTPIAGSSPASAVTPSVTPVSAAAPDSAVVPVQLATPDQQQVQNVVATVDGLKAEAVKAKGEDALVKLRTDAASAQASADGLAKARTKELAQIDARLKRLSLPSGAPRPRLTTAEKRERGDLLGRRARLLGQIRTAEQAGATASATYTQAATKRREDFSSHVFERTASPLEASFWSSLVGSMGPDAERLGALIEDTADTAIAAPEPRGGLSLAAALAVAIALAWPLRRLLKGISRRRTAAAIEAGGLRLSAHAVGAVLIDTVLPGAAAAVLNLGLSWGQLLPDKAEAVAGALVIAVFWGAAILALSRQLAGARTPEERLLAVSERLAVHMRALPWLVALTTGAGFLLHRVNAVVGASIAATIAANCLVSLAYAGVASLVLLAMSAGREADTPEEVARAPGRTLLSLVLSAAIVVTVGAVFAGFTTFAALVSSQIFWVSVLGSATYLLLRFADDAVAALFAPRGWVGRPLTGVLLLRPTMVAQLSVLSSALAQVLIVLGALSLALTPFGSSGELLSSHVLHIGQSVHLGSLVISPRSLGIGLASLLVGFALVHLLQRWVERRFLPVTDWDIGVQTSVSTGVRYLSVGVVIIWALAAAGLGFKQIALVASALSVGIGFGLQQIVQNFVSGLILLVERPVKVGDWVNVGGVEGDVQRVRVRATEIRTFDKTTLIVPNSDLITKTVQNKTIGDPHGRVRLEVSIGAASDAARATEAMLAVLGADPDVLEDPKPNVFIDSLTTGGSVNFALYAYLATPRDGTRVKSRLYGEIIKAFATEKIGFIGGPTEVVLQPGADLKSLVDDIAARTAAKATQAAEPSTTAEPETPAQSGAAKPSSASA